MGQTKPTRSAPSRLSTHPNTTRRADRLEALAGRLEPAAAAGGGGGGTGRSNASNGGAIRE